HSRFSALSRTYRYIIRNSELPSALDRNKKLWVREELDLRNMRRASSFLIGEKDFSSFRSSSCQSKSPNRNIHSIKIKKKGDLLFIDIKANAFLLNMVRIIIGTLLETGLKKKSPKRVNEILEAKDRTLAGKTASPNGLYFVSTEYLKKYKVPNISNSVI
ncbi:MAG: tRNA pseudouridine(38-40) synthase TruA, partial [SAR86 cluster bacterium]|nr:tRNA pseudouridine(38-40) synthase TruA [SAR86 cluster bacterium]